MKKYCLFPALLFLLLQQATAAVDPATNTQPVIPDRVQDRFIPADAGRLSGLLNSHILLNQEKRLLLVDSALLLSGFEHRPGSQKWIGEHVGKFLFAAVNTYRYTHDPRLKALMDDIERKYIATQLPDGYLGTYLPKDYWSEWDVWVHKYAIIGLLSYYSLTGDHAALEAARKAGDLICRTFGNAPGQLDLNKSGYHNGLASGSILGPMVDLYRYTGDPKYLAFAKYIFADWETETGPKIISGLEQYGKVTKVGNAKAYEMLSCFLGVLEFYKLTGEARYLKAMQTAWQDISKNRLYITGTTSSHEHFQDDQVLPAAIDDKMGEGCVTVTWIQFNDLLLGITGEPKYATEIERSVYNHLFAAENPENGCVSYYTPLQGAKPQLCKLTCCLSSVPRAISMIPDMVWGRIGKEFSILLYEPGEVTDSIVTANGKKISLHVVSSTDFPATGNLDYKIHPSTPARFAVNFRVPDWAANYTVTINGIKQPAPAGPLLKIERIWKTSDRITVHFDMPLRKIAGGTSYPGYIAFKRGPQILAVDSVLDPEYKELLQVGVAPGIIYNLTPVSSDLPPTWIGKQAWLLTRTTADNNRSFVLAPFADTGQQGTMQQVWLPVRGN
ncbi:MAG TPA: beta-L-arabinofuranosidase domain-containing protein [Puia sp.]|jgi:hypothetical protein